MPDIANRHRGTLRGRFTDTRVPARVIIGISPEMAERPVIQHLAWMLINLLARQTAEIGAIGLEIPKGIAPTPALTPLANDLGDLAMLLQAAAVQINPTVFSECQRIESQIYVRVGPGTLAAADLTIATSADGWSGYVGQVPTLSVGEDSNPIGAYVAACLCAGEIFKFVRGMASEYGDYANSLWLDAYRLIVSDQYPAYERLKEHIQLVPAVVVGVGAVANGFLHALYPLVQAQGNLVLVDGDPEGITDTNLNRYALLGLSDVGHPKASAAAALFAHRALLVTSADTSWQAWRETHREKRLGLVISAVDTNVARHAIQDALPRIVLGASTKEMRAQVDCYDVLGGGPCLRCYNPVEAVTPDAVVVERLRLLDLAERAAFAEQNNIDPQQLDLYLADPLAHCGMISDSSLQKFAAQTAEPQWAVGFVSVLAGVLLAAEYIKRGDLHSMPSLDAQHSTFRFQFWRPENIAVNAVVSTPPESACSIPRHRRGYTFRSHR